MVVDTNGNIIISDQANFRLRMLEPNGIIHTICRHRHAGLQLATAVRRSMAAAQRPEGQSAAPASRIAIDAQQPHLHRRHRQPQDPPDRRGRQRSPPSPAPARPGYSGDGGPATDAQLNTPSDVAIAPNGTLYIADTYEQRRPHRARRTAPSTPSPAPASAASAATAVRRDLAQLDRPYGVEVAPNGNVYIADTHNQRIREVDRRRPAAAADAAADADAGDHPLHRRGRHASAPTPAPAAPASTATARIACTPRSTGRSTSSSRRRAGASFLDWNNHKVREILPDDTSRRSWAPTSSATGRRI